MMKTPNHITLREPRPRSGSWYVAYMNRLTTTKTNASMIREYKSIGVNSDNFINLAPIIGN